MLCDEIKKTTESISKDEVSRARAQLKAGILMSLESPSSRCAQRARQVLVYGRPLTTEEVIERIEEVNASGIAAAARRIFSGRPTMASLGNFNNLENIEAIHARLK